MVEPHLRIVTKVNQFFLNFLSYTEVDTVISQALVDIIKHEVNDSKEIFFAKGREFDNTVKTVQWIQGWRNLQAG